MRQRTSPSGVAMVQTLRLPRERAHRSCLRCRARCGAWRPEPPSDLRQPRSLTGAASPGAASPPPAADRKELAETPWSAPGIPSRIRAHKAPPIGRWRKSPDAVRPRARGPRRGGVRGRRRTLPPWRRRRRRCRPRHLRRHPPYLASAGLMAATAKEGLVGRGGGQVRCSGNLCAWRRLRDSNTRPSHYEHTPKPIPCLSGSAPERHNSLHSLIILSPNRTLRPAMTSRRLLPPCFPGAAETGGEADLRAGDGNV